jgi:large subunit ribosomal protein L19
MTHLVVQALERKLAGKKLQILRPGYKVRVHQKIREGEKERIQIFEGFIIGQNAGHGASKTVTVRKVVQGIAVEKIFPLASPNVSKIEIVKTFGVRRAKLYYMRDEKGLSSRLRGKLGLIEKDIKHGDKEKIYDNENDAVEVVEAAMNVATPAEAVADETVAETVAAPEAAAEESK